MSDQLVQELSDQFEIRRLLTRYAWAVDTKSWDDFENLFTADALIDYSSSGGMVGTVDEAKSFLAETLPAFPITQHLLANVDVTIDGDRAKARSTCYNPMGAATREGRPHMFFLGIEYHDDLERTTTGWRISRRVEIQRWRHGSLPAELIFPSD